MKKITAFLIAAAVCVLTASMSLTACAVLLGDVDGDGIVTASDARQTLRVAASLELFTPEQSVIADVDSDGEVTAGDARRILRVAAHLDVFENPELPSEEPSEELTSEDDSLPPMTTEPSVSEPTTVLPVTTEPEATAPATTEPTTALPVTTEPTATEPDATEITTMPTVTDPTAPEITTVPPATTEPAGPETTTEPQTEPAPEEPTTQEPEPDVPTDIGIIRSGTYEMTLSGQMNDEDMRLMLVKEDGNLCMRILSDEELSGSDILIVEDTVYIGAAFSSGGDKLLLSEEFLREFFGEEMAESLDGIKKVMALLDDLIPPTLGEPTELTENGVTYFVYEYEYDGAYRKLYVTAQGKLVKIVIDNIDGSALQTFVIESVSGTLSEPYFDLENQYVNYS